ncbi:hypothetical protein [Vagococcus sp. WN89Y]|uniref:hypothetical protein n=1 Tax=Vagococcus sp. WN89Y TaxID=3457258 RepID=UPI003FCCAF14
MICAVKQRIDVQADTLQSALGKKAYNYSLSYKSLHKLEKIVNSQYDIRTNALQFIFGKKNTFKGFDHNNISRLIKDLQVIKPEMSNPAMDNKIDGWINKAQVMLDHKVQAQEKIKNLTAEEANWLVIHKGSNAFIYKHEDFVIKKQKNINEISAQHEVAMCNKYNHAHGREAEALYKRNLIQMPYIENKGALTTHDIQKAVVKMAEKGFFMADARPSNFVKTTKGEVVPVDFRLVYTNRDLNNLDAKIQKEIVNAYVNVGYRCIPAALKGAYRMHIAQIDKHLKQDSPLRYVNTMLTSRASVKHI